MPGRLQHPHVPADALPPALAQDIDAAGYYPELVADVVGLAIAGQEVISHVVHQEATFDTETVRRHLTVLVLTPGRLVICHADDREAEHVESAPVAMATTETVPLHRVRGVVLSHVMSHPEHYRPGSLGREVTLTLGWGAISRLDLVPAQCADPTCEGDHGYEGTVAGDDISLRVSAEVSGGQAVEQVLEFARAVQAGLGR
ncbi:hypothetical protein SAMN05445756_0309 [Kytococcus aerolatus]|uniref:Phosphodiesterase n=1 Tax=Kytococcus aerolatus TaxID=592308 RepID=A0A212T3K1_9MICO|nr:DUF5998 family protein [Kytococcus aerolatus]SNC60585.1 hypothetical protein SAMN05445756_0309 [Kytococcus aerolatus]